MENKKEKSKKRLRIFDITRDGKGVSKNNNEAPGGFKRFFRSYKDNFGKLVSVNIIMVLCNFPVIFLIANLSGYFKIPYSLPLSDLFQNLGGLFAASGDMTPYKLMLFSLEGMQNSLLAPSAVTYVFYAIGALFLFTFGPVCAGTAYVLRNLASGEPVFVWSDFLYAVKRNYKQAIPFGIIDILINVILVFNIYTLITGTSAFFASMLFWMNIVIFIVYFFMRYYMYVQMVTFKLSIFKMIKNSLSFTLLGLKRNLVALLGIILCLFLEFMFLFGTGGLLISFAIAAPLAILFSTCAYAKVFASYYKIKEIMIDPYYEAHPEERKAMQSEQAPLMSDDVTAKERLEEIKKKNGLI